MMASNKEKEESDSKVSFIATNKLTKNKHLWIGDTGASTHMTNTLDGLFNLHNEETTIKIGNRPGLKSTIICSHKTDFAVT